MEGLKPRDLFDVVRFDPNDRRTPVRPHQIESYLLSSVRECPSWLTKHYAEVLYLCVVKTTGHICGHVSLTPWEHDGKILEVTSLCAILPRMCIGLLLFQAAVDYATSHAYKAITLISSDQGIPFYKMLDGTIGGAEFIWEDLVAAASRVVALLRDCSVRGSSLAVFQTKYWSYMARKALTREERAYIEGLFEAQPDTATLLETAPKELAQKLREINRYRMGARNRKRRSRRTYKTRSVRRVKRA